MQVTANPQQFNPSAVSVGPVETTTADMAAICAGFVSVAARGCKNKWARNRLQDALQAALDATQALRRDEARTLPAGGSLHG